MNSSAAALLAMREAAESPFTVSQWQELEHQALIFKYLMAGQPIPLDLVLPIQKSFESVSARFFHHPNRMSINCLLLVPEVSYCSFYGKKVDPEPGRCRRTDGKKWRCSKDAYPDSKYCEKHMHRGRNRSRKHVESQTVSQSSSTMTALQATGGSSSGGSRSFQNLPLHSFGNPPRGGGPGSGSSQSHFNSEVTPYGINNKDHRSVHGYRTEVGEHSFFQASGSNRGLHMDSPLDSAWPLMSSRVASFQTSKQSDNTSILHGDYPQSSLYDSEFSSGEPMKQAGQSLRLFAEWPKTRDSWSVAEAEGSTQTSFSTTQLSISIPMASPDFPTGSPSPHDN